ncbi:MAG: Fic family protein [Desulfatibacillaceae bacterium]
MRAGRYIKQLEGYRAFIPAHLPPDPPIEMDPEMLRLLSDADRVLGRLDGVATTLPDPNLFVAMYVKQEAVYSSQIEGTQSTLEDLLEYEAIPVKDSHPRDVDEVVNYVRAMNHGLNRLGDLPLCLRLIKEIHAELLSGVRGSERSPGEFRTTQNWIGPGGCMLGNAEFVPPPPHEMHKALDNFEKFLHDNHDLPVLIHCALAHAQFETIHPFLDGNGRIGRLLITFLLCQQSILEKPLLYLSYFLKAHRSEYYERLMAIRNQGDWEGWIKFFLRGVKDVSRAATNTAREILELRERHRSALFQMGSSSANALKLLDYMYRRPIVSINEAKDLLDVSYVTASSVIKKMEKAGFLKEVTGQQRYRWFRYEPYVNIFRFQAIQAEKGKLPDDGQDMTTLTE